MWWVACHSFHPLPLVWHLADPLSKCCLGQSSSSSGPSSGSTLVEFLPSSLWLLLYLLMKLLFRPIEICGGKFTSGRCDFLWTDFMHWRSEYAQCLLSSTCPPNSASNDLSQVSRIPLAAATAILQIPCLILLSPSSNTSASSYPTYPEEELVFLAFL